MLRRCIAEDRPALIALALAEDAAWSGAGAGAVSEEETGEYIDAYEPGAVFERDGLVTGYAAVDEASKTMLLLDPREDPAPALEALVPWLERRGRDEVDTYAADTARIAWLEAHGFSHRRSSFDLERGVEAPLAAAVLPEGVVLEAFRRGEEDEAVHALVYLDAAWGAVPGHSERSLESWSAMISPEYRGWVARRDGTPVGWVAGRVYPDGRGWVQQIAVARPARGRGLGRALLLHSLSDLVAHGATELALGVEAANEHALGLYRDVGFEVAREFRVYARPPRAAALVEAAERGDADAVRRLLAAGAGADARDFRGRTAVTAAAKERHAGVVRVLVDAGADVDLQDAERSNALLVCGETGDVDVLREVLRGNPDLRATNRYGGVAHIPASERGHVAMVEALLQAGIPVDHVNRLGWTALLEAVMLGDGGPDHQRIVGLLLDAGADRAIADNDGVTALEHARQRGYDALVRLLEA